ncbi:MAG TPA: hypothetical protein VKR56_02965 [Candidatus Cybelea sp.]|nr:hypothetical protein [Candidatus Cybelea sp.]
MNRPSTLRLSSPALASMGLMVVALGLVACNGSGLSSGGALPARAGAGAVPATSVSPTPYGFSFQTVDKPGTDYNRVTGINDLRQISGYHGSGSASDPAVGYRAAPPYVQMQFLHVEYPGSLNTYAMALSNDFLCVGYFLSNQVGDHTLGFVKDHGLYTSFKNPKTPLGPDTVNELLGVNDYDAAVGFYTDGSGKNHGYELYVTQGKYADLTPSGFDSTEAVGINDPGNIVGFGESSDKTIQGWIYLNGVYKNLLYPNSVSTEALGINYQNQVVGEYTNSDGTTHGFIVTSPTGAKPIWQSIDEPEAAGTTVVTSINDRHAISGSYVDSVGTTHGFTATVDVNTCVASDKCHTKR